MLASAGSQPPLCDVGRRRQRRAVSWLVTRADALTGIKQQHATDSLTIAWRAFGRPPASAEQQGSSTAVHGMPALEMRHRRLWKQLGL